MKTTYVIGAGCTKSYQPDNEFNLSSPLDNDFFEICNKILLEKTEFRTAFSSLIDHLKMFFGLELGSSTKPEGFSMEAITTILDLEAREKKDLKYIDTLINLICIVFDVVLKGPTSQIHTELVNRFNPGDIVISYNYDITLDNALMETKNVEEGIYRLNFDRKHDGSWNPCDNSPADFSVLKLHGSLNWLKCSRCGALLYYGGRKAVSELSYQLMGLGSSSIDLKCPTCQSNELKPLLIPPLLSKELHVEELRYSWYLAEKAIQSAEKIVVIGYSLPSTDFYSEFLFRKAINQRFRGKPQLQIVDINNTGVSKRFKTIFGISECEKYTDLKDYLDKTVANLE